MEPEDFIYFLNDRPFLTDFALQYLLEFELIVDGASGGLIIGPSHSEDGIKILHKDELNRVEVTGEIEGFEYLLNPFATAAHGEYANKINNENKGKIQSFLPYDVPKDIKIIDARRKMIAGTAHQRMIIFSAMPQMVLNKVTSKKHLNELNKMNTETWRK